MKIFYDSPMYTYEGITYASRMMATQLYNKGHQMMVTDPNYQAKFGEHFKKMYNPIDTTKKSDYLFFKNTRTEHWAFTSKNVENFVGYCVLEGNKIPQTWVQNMNYPHVDLVMTPSEYCKQVFKNCGVTKKIEVIPHGYDPELYKPVENNIPMLLELQDKFTFFGSGAIYGLQKEDRKGLDILIEAFKDTFKDNEDVALALKVSTLYAKNSYAQQGKTFVLKDYLESIGMDTSINVMWIEESMKPEQMVRLYNQVNVCVSPSRGEGFGLMPFEALACGVPIIVTGGGGFLQYANEKNARLIKCKEDFPAEMRYPYFDEPAFNYAKSLLQGTAPQETDYLSNWFSLDVENLKEHMKWAYENYDEFKGMAMDYQPTMKEQHTWDAVGTLLDNTLQKEFPELNQND